MRPAEPIFDATPHPFGDGPVDPVVHDASIAALRQRTVNFAAKRYADMMFVSGLDRAAADRHFRLRAAVVPAGLDERAAGVTVQPEADAAFAAGRFVIETDASDRRATVRWGDTVGRRCHGRGMAASCWVRMARRRSTRTRSRGGFRLPAKPGRLVTPSRPMRRRRAWRLPWMRISPRRPVLMAC